MQPNTNNDPLLEDNEDRPSGTALNSTPTPATFTHTSGTAKKKITPVNETAVREALAQDTHVKPPIDTSKIYNQPPGPSGPAVPGAALAGAQPTTPAPRLNELSAATQPRTAVQVSSVVPGLQLYAIVMIILSGLNILAYLNRLTDLYGPHTVSLLSVCINVLPIASAVYLLRGKRTVIIKALLIVIGLAYAYLFVSYGVLVTRLHSVLATIFIFSTLVCGGLVYWTWRIYSNVEGLDDEK